MIVPFSGSTIILPRKIPACCIGIYDLETGAAASLCSFPGRCPLIMIVRLVAVPNPHSIEPSIHVPATPEIFRLIDRDQETRDCRLLHRNDGLFEGGDLGMPR